jgi:DNA-binding CsgD family transcriptional regulator
LDFVLREYTWRESREPDQVTRDELALLRGVVAALDGRKAVLSQVLLSLSRTTTPHVAQAAALLPMVWTFNTRGRLRAPVPDVTGLPGAELVAQMQWLGHLALRTSPLHPVEVDLVKQRLGSPEELAKPRHDGSWAVRLAAAAFLGAASQDRDLCAVAVRCLEPFADQFLVLWPYLPVGPVGWYLARALRVLGRHQDAVSALAAAQQACAGLAAVGWSLRVAAEQALVCAVDATPRVADVVLASAGAVATRRFAGVVAEIRCRVNEESTDAGLLVGATAGPVVTPIQPGIPNGVPGLGRPAAPHDEDGAGSPGSPGTAGSAERRPGVPALSERETDIMALAATGCTNQEIAKRLFLSVATVERHCTNLYRRLGVRNRAQALGVLGQLGPSDNA